MNSDNDFSTGSDSKSADVVSRGEAEPIASGERIAAEAIVLENDDGSGGNSSMGQYVPTDDADDRQNAVSEGPSRRDGSGESSTSPTPSLDINIEFIEPFREFASSYIVRLQGSLRPSM
ncbi:hypothetical protein ACLOJK_004153 [Asimina triloba]